MNTKPNPSPKAGSEVNFVLGERHIVCPAKVTKVHEKTDDRKIDVEAVTPDGVKLFNDVIFDEVASGKPMHGNSWHWPAEEKKDDGKKPDDKK